MCQLTKRGVPLLDGRLVQYANPSGSVQLVYLYSRNFNKNFEKYILLYFS